MRKLLTVGFPLALVAALAATPTASSARSFKDPLSDAFRGPDIYNVHVGHDVLNGQLVFWVQVANRPDDLLAAEGLVVLLDTDKNPSTGAEEGADYALVVVRDGFAATRWDGSRWVAAPSPSLQSRFVKSALSQRISVAPADLGGVGDFNFYVATFSDSGIPEDTDFAPNEGFWSYTVAPAPLQVAVTGSVLAPAAPVAGKSLAATIRLLRRDTFDPLTAGDVRCTLRVGTKSIAARASGFAGGAAFCKWSLPRSARGKLVSATVTVAYKGATVTKTFRGRAR